MSKADEPAFPTHPNKLPGHFSKDGLTKREYAAIHIAAALVSNQELLGPDEDRAKRAVTITDALLAALERKPE
jgi:hypothetical protein